MSKYLKIGSVGIAFMLAGAVVYLFWQVNNLKSEKAALEWELITLGAETDTVFIQTEYSISDTVWKRVVKTVYRDSLQIDTVWQDMPIMTGEMSFDTTKIFGQNHNPLSVRVSGRFYYPAEFSHRNWLLIVPEFGRTPQLPVTPRTPRKWGIGLAYAVTSSSANSIGGFGRFKHTSIALYRQVNPNGWMIGLRYEILRF